MRPVYPKRLQLTCLACLIAVASLFASAVQTAAVPPPAARHTQAPQSIGSINSTGAVAINGRPAAGEATIFPGDTLKTGESATAAFSMSGKGSLKLAPNSELSFVPDPRYTAELRSGTVIMNSFSGATDISVRAGPFVIAPVIQAQQSASKIERQADGSFAISCLDGSVGLIPLEGATGKVLESGQSVRILPSGQVEQAPQGPEVAPATTPADTGTGPVSAPPVAVHENSKKNEYILLGVAGGVGVIIAVALAGRGHGSSSVSPSAP